VDANNYATATVNMYDNLFTVANPDGGEGSFLDYLNPDSLKVLSGCIAEKAVEQYEAPAHFQFMRTGYFCLDKDSTKENIIFNRSVSLKDGFKK
jgi:glutaminyl-tRNA synthetase